MLFNKHSDREGHHSVLSPSQYHWINYTEDKFAKFFKSRLAASRGDALHKLAHDHIRLKVLMADDGNYFNAYVNDAIRYGMAPEQVLEYSRHAFGSADTIGFAKSILRVHDLKTGKTQSSFSQLDVYAALFCLEYGVSPWEIEIEERIYQSSGVRVQIGDPAEISRIIDRIVTLSKIADEMLREML